MRLWQFLLVLIGAVLLFGAGLLIFNFLVMPRLIHRNTVVLVPDLRGRTPAEAEGIAGSLGLQVAETRQRFHPSVSAGLILDQDPEAHVPIRRGRVVRVITSSGPPVGLVPSLTGLSRRQAEITLQRESFQVGRVLRLRRPQITVPTVYFQYPPAGVQLRKGEPVALVVAEPVSATVYRMPDLRGISLFAATEKISASGCVLAPVLYERTRRVPPNTILEQKPPAGERIRKGARIELVASSR
jgi:serine/threonine-protein kinase